jgi:hypothetical protein
MARYLMNAAVIPYGCPGTFTYRLATVAELVAFVQAGAVVNTIAYAESLAWVAELTGVRFEPSRTAPPLRPGDEAFVIRRTTRLAKIWRSRAPFDPAQVELGVLRCEPLPPAPPPKASTRQRLHHGCARQR